MSFAIRVAVVPPTDVNAPAMITAVPPGATTIEVISPLTLGLNAVSITPVVALNARMRLRVSVVVLPAFCACVNVPAAIIRFPTCTIASTCPFVMLGVQLTGSAETTCAWDIWKACPVPALPISITAVSASTQSRASRLRGANGGVMTTILSTKRARSEPGGGASLSVIPR